MFRFFGKKGKQELGAPAMGKAVSLKKVNDPTFAEEILGKGVAVILQEGKIYAPADGVIEMLFETLHAVSMTTEGGAEVLIHVGLDTVKLKGQYFEGHVKAGDKVKKGDLLISVDLESVKRAGYDVITPIVICNSDKFANIEAVTEQEVKAGDIVLLLTES